MRNSLEYPLVHALPGFPEEASKAGRSLVLFHPARRYPACPREVLPICPLHASSASHRRGQNRRQSWRGMRCPLSTKVPTCHGRVTYARGRLRIQQCQIRLLEKTRHLTAERRKWFAQVLVATQLLMVFCMVQAKACLAWKPESGSQTNPPWADVGWRAGLSAMTKAPAVLFRHL